MNATAKQFLRCLDRIERLHKEREQKAKRVAKERLALHIRYVAYKAAQEDECEVPWA